MRAIGVSTAASPPWDKSKRWTPASFPVKARVVPCGEIAIVSTQFSSPGWPARQVARRRPVAASHRTIVPSRAAAITSRPSGVNRAATVGLGRRSRTVNTPAIRRGPDPHRGVVAGRDQPRAARVEAGPIDLVFMPSEDEPLLPRIGVPDPGGSVLARRDESTAVGGVLDVVHFLSFVPDPALALDVREAPQVGPFEPAEVLRAGRGARADRGALGLPWLRSGRSVSRRGGYRRRTGPAGLPSSRPRITLCCSWTSCAGLAEPDRLSRAQADQRRASPGRPPPPRAAAAGARPSAASGPAATAAAPGSARRGASAPGPRPAPGPKRSADRAPSPGISGRSSPGRGPRRG